MTEYRSSLFQKCKDSMQRDADTISLVTSVVREIVAGNPVSREDFDTLLSGYQSMARSFVLVDLYREQFPEDRTFDPCEGQQEAALDRFHSFIVTAYQKGQVVGFPFSSS